MGFRAESQSVVETAGFVELFLFFHNLQGVLQTKLNPAKLFWAIFLKLLPLLIFFCMLYLA